MSTGIAGALVVVQFGSFVAGQTSIFEALVCAFFVGIFLLCLVQVRGDKDGSLALAAVQHGNCVIARCAQLGLLAEKRRLAVGKELQALAKDLRAACGVGTCSCPKETMDAAGSGSFAV